MPGILFRRLLAVAVAVMLPLAARGADNDMITLDQLVAEPNLILTKVPDGVQIANKPGQAAKLLTPTEIKTPLVIVARVKTSKNNIRLYYGDKGAVIFDWEVNGKELRHHDPKSGEEKGIADKGAIPPREYATIEWTIDAKGSRVSVDGVERFAKKGNYSGLSGKVGIGTYDGSTLTIKAFSVRPTVKPPDDTSDTGGVALSVDVPCAEPKAGAATEPALSDSDAIERPEFVNVPKALKKSLSTISTMTVLESADGEETGQVMELLAVVEPESRRGDTAGVGFVRAQNDKMMRTSFEEAVRAVKLRYPLWQPGHIDLSFRDKFTAIGGPSAGTAFAVLMLSTLEGFDIDPHCAITGDISVDWHTEKVGGIPVKLRGAYLDKRTIAIIPHANVDALSDMALLEGLSSIYDIQILSADTLQQAVAAVRQDRAAKLAQAITQFAELQALLEKSPNATLRSPETLKSLQQIVALAPNHESAKYLLSYVQNKAPKTLSLTATYFGCCRVLYPYRLLFAMDEHTIGVTVPAQLQVASRKYLDALRPIADPKLAPVLRDLAALTEVANNVSSGQSPLSSIQEPLTTLESDWGDAVADPHFIEDAIRSGY